MTTAGKVAKYVFLTFPSVDSFPFSRFFCSQPPALGWQGHEGRTSHCCCSSRCFGHLRRHSIDELLKVSPFSHPRNGCGRPWTFFSCFLVQLLMFKNLPIITNPATRALTIFPGARMNDSQNSIDHRSNSF